MYHHFMSGKINQKININAYTMSSKRMVLFDHHVIKEVLICYTMPSYWTLFMPYLQKCLHLQCYITKPLLYFVVHFCYLATFANFYCRDSHLVVIVKAPKKDNYWQTKVYDHSPWSHHFVDKSIARRYIVVRWLCYCLAITSMISKIRNQPISIYWHKNRSQNTEFWTTLFQSD